MNKQEFKFIKGKCSPGTPADICFYTDVDYWSVDSFLWEFDYLVKYVCPSKIRVHINSVGGSCVEGMSIFSKLIDCTIPIETINDALAASMGSIIWAAGDELYMKDYALLMIHNPFCDKSGEKEYNQVTEAFTQQLKTIYTKRFGLSEDEIQAIMDGKEGEDGTFLTAAQAVEKGFVKADHIIETPQVVKDQLQAALNNSKDLSQIKAVYAMMASTQPIQTINEQNLNTKISNNNKMEKNEITVVAALFGLTGDKATTEHVSAKIKELKAKADKADDLEKTLEDTKSELTKTKAELTGSQTSVKNLTEDLNKTKDELKVYQEAEAKAQEEKVNSLIDKAIANCKIDKEERDTYIKMAQNDFELAEKVLAKIPGRENLTEAISNANEEGSKEGLKSEEQKVMDEVEKVVGKDFKFRTL